jgi:hypothetical protein
VGSGLPIAQQYFFVNSVRGSDGNEGTDPESPFATIDYAVGKCTASRGACIIALPGHVETVVAANGLALDVAGINLFGVGQGSLQPRINFTTAVSASMRVSAANILMSNFRFTGGIDALTNPIDIQASDFSLLNSQYTDVTGQATDVILSTAAADRITIGSWRHNGAAAAGANAGIAIVGGDSHHIYDIYADGNFAVAFLDIRTTATTNLWCHDWTGRTRNNADALGVDTITGSTGTIGPNMFFWLNENAANFAAAFSGATFVYHNLVSVVNLAGEIGGRNVSTQDGFKTASTNA